MNDALTDLLHILHARSTLSTGMRASGNWSVRLESYAGLKFNAMVQGGAWLQVDGGAPVQLREGDCFLLAGGHGFTMASDLALTPQPAAQVFAHTVDGVARIGAGTEVDIVAGRMTLAPGAGAIPGRVAACRDRHRPRSGFAAAFKRAVGVAPLAYLTRWRLQQAGQALRQDGVTVARAAESAGFASESAFGHAFRRVYGCSPGRYAAQGR